MKAKSFLLLAVLQLSLVGLFVHITPVIRVFAAPSWSSPIAVEQHLGIDILPSAVQASNGTMWLAWQTNRYRGDSFYDIAVKTGSLGTNGVSWTSPTRFTTNTGYNSGPAMTKLANGTILLFWSYKSGSSYNIFYSRNNAGSWSAGTQATSTTLNDTSASASVGRDGTLWLFWTRINSTCQTCTPDEQLYYKTLKGNTWSNETKLTNDSNQNFGSSAVVGKDSVVRVVWSKGQPSLNNYQIYYKTFNGTVWGADTQVVTSSSADIHPSLAQDRNGTLWIVWGRQIVLSPTTQYYVLFSKNSINNGATWSAETQMTNTATTVDSKMPDVVQSSNDKSLWIFYITNPTVDDDIWGLRSSAISPIHDVSVLSFNPIYSPANTLQYSGGFKTIGQSPLLTLNVTIGDPGDFTEIVQVSLTVFNSTNFVFHSMAAVVSPGGVTNLLFRWNTTGVKPALYGYTAAIGPVAGESLGNSGDDSLSHKNVFRILPIGDIDQDGWVSVVDAGIFIYNFNFGCSTPSRYNPLADPDNDCMIGIIDVGQVEINFGIVS